MNEKPTGIRIIIKELLKDKLALGSLILLAIISCGNKTKSKTEEVKGIDKKYLEYVDSLKSENDLKIRMGEEPITIVGKKLKVGDKITQVPLVVNTKLEEKNIFDDNVSNFWNCIVWKKR